MENDEVLKAVFPLLDGQDLASCMIVSKQWRDIARDDYFWKCLCGKKWPSVCKLSTPPPPITTYQKLYQTLHKRKRERTLLPLRFSFPHLEFYIDIWIEDKLIFSEVIPGPVLRNGYKIPPNAGAFYRFEEPNFKIVLPVEPKFTLFTGQTVTLSMFVGEGLDDFDTVASIITRSDFWCTFHMDHIDYLDFSPAYPYTSRTRAWISLLYLEHGYNDFVDVFGIELDFVVAIGHARLEVKFNFLF